MIQKIPLALLCDIVIAISGITKGGRSGHQLHGCGLRTVVHYTIEATAFSFSLAKNTTMRKIHLPPIEITDEILATYFLSIL